MNNLKRLLILSNAPFASTGYGIQARHIGVIASELGYEVGFVANHGLTGSAINWRGMPIFPQRYERFCMDVIGDYVEYFNADAVLSLYDLWHFPMRASQNMGVPWIAMVPIEGYPITGYLLRILRTAAYVVTFSKFGRNTLLDAGLATDYIQHAIDTDVFKPGSRLVARQDFGIPNDNYMVTMVAMNKGAQPYRKGFPEMLRAWKPFSDEYPEAILYMHSNREPIAPNYESGFKFGDMIDALEINWESIAFPDKTNFNVGIDDAEMAKIYQASDVVILPSWAEGFGLPSIEAQACGTPMISHDCSAMSELIINGLLIPRGEAWWMPERKYWWHRPGADDIYDTLVEAKEGLTGEYAERLSQAGVEAMREEYSLDAVLPKWAEFLSRVGREIW